MASSQGTSVSSSSFSRWASHDIFLFKYHFLLRILRFLFFFSGNIWPMWLANSKRQPCFYPPQSHTQEDTQNSLKNWQTWWETCAVPENIQFSFFRAVFYTVKLHSLTYRVWGPLGCMGLYSLYNYIFLLNSWTLHVSKRERALPTKPLKANFFGILVLKSKRRSCIIWPFVTDTTHNTEQPSRENLQPTSTQNSRHTYSGETSVVTTTAIMKQNHKVTNTGALLYKRPEKTT
jgi:hypothetical protein